MKEGQTIPARTLEDYSSSDDDISVSDVSSTDSERGQDFRRTEQWRNGKRIRDNGNGDDNIGERRNRDKESRKRKKKHHKDKREKKCEKKKKKKIEKREKKHRKR